jgi:hypothetical protein
MRVNKLETCSDGMTYRVSIVRMMLALKFRIRIVNENSIKKENKSIATSKNATCGCYSNNNNLEYS